MSKNVSLVGVKSVEKNGKRMLQGCLPSFVKLHDIDIEMNRFKLGSLDAMLQGLDRVIRLEQHCESFLKRIEKVYSELDPEKNLYGLTIDAPHGGQVTLLKYLEKFSWDDSNFGRTGSLPNQLKNFEDKIESLDKTLKIRLTSYQETKSKMNTIGDRKDTLSNFLNGDLNETVYELVKQNKIQFPEKTFYNTSFFESLIVFVPKDKLEDFKKEYELDAEYIVPQSLLVLSENYDYIMTHVFGFKRGAEEIKAVYKKKYGALTREFEMNLNVAKARENEKKRITEQNQTDKNQLKNQALETFKELFVMLVHIKIHKVVIDSNLRFGGPEGFLINLLVYDKGKDQRIIQDLIKTFAEKEKIEFYGTKEQLNDTEDFFPFVYSAFVFNL